MAVNQRSTWDDFFELPSENESYLTYFLSLKFIWAPLKNLFSLVANRIFELFNANNNHVPIIPLDENPAFAPVAQQTNMTAAQMIDSYKTQEFLNDVFENTVFTSFLAYKIFSEGYEANKPAILEKIKALIELAKTDAKVRQLLTTPNNPSQENRERHSCSGMPLNTPLMLMVKAGNVECVKLLLPFYSADELMTPTLRGNSVFHIAALTGQAEILEALIQRAQVLNIRNVLIENTNNARHTPEQMLQALFLKANSFKNLGHLCDIYFGGEEIQKAPCGSAINIQCCAIKHRLLDFDKTQYSHYLPIPGIKNTSPIEPKSARAYTR